MVRAKKQTYKYVPRDERPEFIAVVAALPDARAKLEALAEQYQRTFNAAILAGNLDVLKVQDDALAAVAIKLNGGEARGALGDDGPLAAIIALKAPPLGQIPQWGQDGEFLLEVAGIRIRVRARSSTLSVVLHVDLNVVDLDKLFVSETGYRSTYIWADRSLGLTVDQAVRRDVEQMLAAKGGKPCLVKPDAFVRSHWEGVPTWLSPAMHGVTRNGQLTIPLSGCTTPASLIAKAPISNRDRQKAFRNRKRERAAALAAEGVQAIELSHTERCVLSLGLLAHEDLDHRPKDWATTKKIGFDAILAKLWPEGDNGRYLSEPKRSTYRPTAFLRDELVQQNERVRRLQEENQALQLALQQIAQEVGAPTAAPVSKAVEQRLRDQILVLQEQNAVEVADRARAFDAVAVLQKRLKIAGLCFDYRAQPGE